MSSDAQAGTVMYDATHFDEYVQELRVDLRRVGAELGYEISVRINTSNAIPDVVISGLPRADEREEFFRAIDDLHPDGLAAVREWHASHAFCRVVFGHVPRVWSPSRPWDPREWHTARRAVVAEKKAAPSKRSRACAPTPRAATPTASKPKPKPKRRRATTGEATTHVVTLRTGHTGHTGTRLFHVRAVVDPIAQTVALTRYDEPSLVHAFTAGEVAWEERPRPLYADLDRYAADEYYANKVVVRVEAVTAKTVTLSSSDEYPHRPRRSTVSGFAAQAFEARSVDDEYAHGAISVVQSTGRMRRVAGWIAATPELLPAALRMLEDAAARDDLVAPEEIFAAIETGRPFAHDDARVEALVASLARPTLARMRAGHAAFVAESH